MKVVYLLFILININFPEWIAWLTGVGGVIAIISGIFKNLSNILSFFKVIFGLFKFKDRSNKIIKLKKHIIFKKINDTLKMDQIANTTSSRAEITVILKDIKLNSFNNRILNFLQEDFKSFSKQQITDKAKDLLFEYVKESNELFQKESNNKKEEKTAKLIISKFNIEETEQIRNAISVIEDINNNSDITKKFTIIDNILTAFQFLVNNIINNTKETIYRLNGELSGMYFRGKKIEDHEERI